MNPLAAGAITAAAAAPTPAAPASDVTSSAGVVPGLPLNFNTAEAELRSIDLDFAAGRLSAFGSGSSHEEVVRELKKIADLEVQVFIRSTAQLRALHDEEQLVHKTLKEFTEMRSAHSAAAAVSIPRIATTSLAAEAGAPSTSASSAATPSTGTTAVFANNATSNEFPSNPQAFVTQAVQALAAGGNAAPAVGESATPTVATGDNAAPWNLLGGSDKAFEQIGKLFRVKEASMKAISENMRQMAKHVAASNESLQQAHASTT